MGQKLKVSLLWDFSVPMKNECMLQAPDGEYDALSREGFSQ